MASIDYKVFFVVYNGIASLPEGAAAALWFFAELLPWFVLLNATAFVCGQAFRRKERVFAILSVLVASAALSRVVLAESIRFVLDRPRPFEVMDFTPLLSHGPGASFPSGHAAFFFAAAAALWPFSRLASATLFAASTLMGFARVAGGIHWPSDIIAGALVGIFAAWVIRLAQSRMSKRT